MEVIVGLLHLFVALCLCGSLLGSPHPLLGSLSAFVDRDECEYGDFRDECEWGRV
jgi:hypothetical protein